MVIKEILALAGAGFSKEEILALASSEEETEVSNETKAPSTKDNSPDVLGEMMKEIKSLREAVQASNITSKSNVVVSSSSADDITKLILGVKPSEKEE